MTFATFALETRASRICTVNLRGHFRSADTPPLLHMALACPEATRGTIMPKGIPGSRGICSVENCDRPSWARELCAGHYARWFNHGDEFDRSPIKSRNASVEDRFWSKVQKTDEASCWLWTGTTNRDGYGSIRMNGAMVKAHRFSYEISGQTIPKGYGIDHICGVPACVNPTHLRLATHKQNMENVALRSTNTSGVRGVSWVPRLGRWQALVGHNRRNYHVGVFKELADAEAAVIAKRNELFTHNNEERSTKRRNP